MNTKRSFILAMLAAFSFLAVLTACPALAEGDFKSRSHGASRDQMLARGNGGFGGMAFFRPVLSGVLYRAGFSGGDKSHTGLSDAQRQELCKAGFSEAFYIDFGTKTNFKTTDCGANQLSYHKGSSNSAQGIMKDIHDIIKNPNKGPALVHCMWGVHSSGSVSAMALMQFCGWSESKAKAYWEDARNNANCSGGCGKWIDSKLKNFKVDPALTISAEEQQRICPK